MPPTSVPPTSVPEVDYLATSERPRFESLPGPVRDAVGRIAGSPVRRAAPPVSSGFGGAYAGLLDLEDGRRVFAKGVPPTMPFVLEATRREAQLLPVLTGLDCATRLVGFEVVDDGAGPEPWHVLVLEAVDGTQPGRPWDTADAEAAHAVCLEIARATPSVAPGAGLAHLSDLLADDPGPVTTVDALVAGDRPWPAGHGVPGSSAGADLARLARGITGAVRGDALLHCDLRPDNLVRERDGRMRAVDWNHLCLGAPWVDLVMLWPLLHHHGVDVRRFATSPLLDGVPDDTVDTLLSWFVGFMLADLDEPPPFGCTPALRAHALFFSDIALRLLAHRRGWTLGEGARIRR